MQHSDEFTAHICRGSGAQNILTPLSAALEGHLNDGKNASKFTERWGGELTTLANEIHDANCDRLYLLAIEILKKTAFLDLPSKNTFVWNCYSTIVELWKKYLLITKGKVNRVSAEDLLGWWLRDLESVNVSQLGSYTQLLSLEEVQKSTKLKSAIDKLEECLVKNLLPDNVSDVDNAGFNLIESVLEPLLNNKKKKIFESLPSATNIACLCALKGSDKTLRRLIGLVILLHKNKYNIMKSHPQSILKTPRFIAYTNTYNLLSDMYLKARSRKMYALCQCVEGIIPFLGGWKRNRRRKSTDIIKAQFDISSGNKLLSVKGHLLDIDPLGKCYHFCLDNISSCFVVRGSAKPVPGKKKLQSVALSVKDIKGSDWTFRTSSAKLSFHKKDWDEPFRTLNTTALPIRGWPNESKDLGGCGAVFFIPDLEMEVESTIEVLPEECQSRQSDIKDTEGA